MKTLELLAPARTADIGIAAIDCGADAVYIAGPGFGARQAAGNSVEDVARLCAHARPFGARVYATVNTIVYEEELPQVKALVEELAAAGVDALIVQDPAVAEFARGAGMVIHASTQCAVRSADAARFTESLGYGRIVLERQMSLEEIKAVRAAVDAELEFFVHGALCVSYSGQCYLSEYLTGRSANRGACAQACRSLYDLEDASGKVLARSRALLSLKDLCLLQRLEDLAAAGICSFKIEGRLKGESYVRNVVRAYSRALDGLVEKEPSLYRRSSFGRVAGSFAPDLGKTFNRGYTELFLNGDRPGVMSEGGGEFAGTVGRLTRDGFVLSPAPGIVLANGDGFTFKATDGAAVGFRADVVEGFTVRCKKVGGLVPGTKLYRNLSAAFERAVDASRPERLIEVSLKVRIAGSGVSLEAVTEDGRVVTLSENVAMETANKAEKALEAIRSQLSKRSGHYSFTLESLEIDGSVPFFTPAFLNGLRRTASEKLDAIPVTPLPLRTAEPYGYPVSAAVTYKANVANSTAREMYLRRGAGAVEDAYELRHRPAVELMRMRYCLRRELGLCSRDGHGSSPLFLRNAGKRLTLRFHCRECEMTVED